MTSLNISHHLAVQRSHPLCPGHGLLLRSGPRANCCGLTPREPIASGWSLTPLKSVATRTNDTDAEFSLSKPLQSMIMFIRVRDSHLNVLPQYVATICHTCLLLLAKTSQLLGKVKHPPSQLKEDEGAEPNASLPRKQDCHVQISSKRRPKFWQLANSQKWVSRFRSL